MAQRSTRKRQTVGPQPNEPTEDTRVIEFDSSVEDDDEPQVVTPAEPQREERETTPKHTREEFLEQRIRILELEKALAEERLQTRAIGTPRGGSPDETHATRKGPARERKFKEHKATYAGRSILEHRTWVTGIERDHQYFGYHFVMEEDKVYHAQSTLTAGSKAAKRWQVVQNGIDPASYTWVQMKEEMLNVLGPPETRERSVYDAWFKLEWRPDPNGLLNTVEALEDLMKDPPSEGMKFNHLWRIIPASMTHRLQGAATLTNREELVQALNNLLLEDRKTREPNQTGNPNPRSDNPRSDKKGKGKYKKRDRDTPSPTERPEAKKHASRFSGKPVECYNCGKQGHTSRECNSSKKKGPGSNPNSIPIRQNQMKARAAEKPAEPDKGKGQAS